MEREQKKKKLEKRGTWTEFLIIPANVIFLFLFRMGLFSFPKLLQYRVGKKSLPVFPAAQIIKGPKPTHPTLLRLYPSLLSSSSST